MKPQISLFGWGKKAVWEQLPVATLCLFLYYMPGLTELPHALAFLVAIKLIHVLPFTYIL